MVREQGRRGKVEAGRGKREWKRGKGGEEVGRGSFPFPHRSLFIQNEGIRGKGRVSFKNFETSPYPNRSLPSDLKVGLVTSQ